MEQIRKGYLYLLAGVAALGGFLFGFDIAIITGAMPFFEKHFGLTPLELGGVNSALLFLLLLFLVPETPRFLFKLGREKEAFEVLRKIGGDELANSALAEIRGSFAETLQGWAELNRPGIRRALVIGFVLAVLVQVSGINAIIDYAPRILQTAGWKMDAALFSTFGLGIVNVVFTLVSVYTVDRRGRKPLYLVGSIGMTVALALLTMLSAANAFTGVLVLSLCIVFIMFFSSCIGPVFWTLMSELFPNRVRGLAMSIPVFTQWFFNALVVFLFPWMLHNLPTLSWGLLTLMALAQVLFTWIYVPETKGKSLEQIEHFWHLQDR